MSDMLRRTGGCLCGAVRFVVEKAGSEVDACHCSMCRRWAGGPIIALDCGDAISFEGADSITRYRSSDWAERGFCKLCGSSLFYRLLQDGRYAVSAGAFDDQTDFTLSGEIFIDDKPKYYDFAGDRCRMTGAEVFAMFVASGETAG